MTSAQITDEDCEKLLALATQPLFRGFQGSAELDALGLGQDEQARAFRKSSIERYLTEKLFIEPQISDRISDDILNLNYIDNNKIADIVSSYLDIKDRTSPTSIIDPQSVEAQGVIASLNEIITEAQRVASAVKVTETASLEGKPKWKDRTEFRADPVAWAKETYKDEIASGTVTLEAVRRYDSALIQQINRKYGTFEGIFPSALPSSKLGRLKADFWRRFVDSHVSLGAPQERS
ncbi:MAG: hypothetical protein KDJ34_16645 [Candidatus Competibacteraceae bacterium]|nr:hypothetical protein [Candidatus Competibacteraceae bacterium]